MLTIITEECVELSKEINSGNRFVENGIQQYMSEMDNLRIQVDQGELVSDFAIQHYTESADNKFIAKVKLAIIKLKDAIIKFFKDVIMKIKTSSLMPRLRKCQSDIEKYGAYFPSGYINVEITDDDLERAKKELQMMMHELSEFGAKIIHTTNSLLVNAKGDNIGTKIYGGMTNLGLREVDFVLDRVGNMSPNKLVGGKVKISNISKSIDKRISSISNYNKQCSECTSKYDEVSKKLNKIDEPDLAREVHEACVAYANATQRAIKLEMAYCVQIIKQVNGLVAEAKKVRSMDECAELEFLL